MVVDAIDSVINVNPHFRRAALAGVEFLNKDREHLSVGRVVQRARWVRERHRNFGIHVVAGRSTPVVLWRVGVVVQCGVRVGGGASVIG